jgi:2-phosphosulfolactate phosphatase
VDIWGQGGSDIRLEWGGHGVAALGRACAVLVVVDVLSFSTTVDLVLGQGGLVRPLSWRGGSSPRPSSVTSMAPSTVLDLPSPNGATLCTAAAGTTAHVLTGCLRNSRAVAAMAHRLAEGEPVGIIPAGERWGVNLFTSGSGGPLRPCVEDQLGAGAIVEALVCRGRSASPEAMLAAAAYRVTDVEAALVDCASGRELTAAGHRGDVELAAAVGVSSVAPVLADGIMEGWQ